MVTVEATKIESPRPGYPLFVIYNKHIKWDKGDLHPKLAACMNAPYANGDVASFVHWKNLEIPLGLSNRKRSATEHLASLQQLTDTEATHRPAIISDYRSPQIANLPSPLGNNLVGIYINWADVPTFTRLFSLKVGVKLEPSEITENALQEALKKSITILNTQTDIEFDIL